MSTAKYANLPDIVRRLYIASGPLLTRLQDTAPDVYETEDVFPTVQDTVSPHAYRILSYPSDALW